MGSMWGTWAKMWQNIWEPFRAKLEENNEQKGKQWENICDNLGKYRKKGYMWEPCGKNVAKQMANM